MGLFKKLKKGAKKGLKKPVSLLKRSVKSVKKHGFKSLSLDRLSGNSGSSLGQKIGNAKDQVAANAAAEAAKAAEDARLAEEAKKAEEARLQQENAALAVTQQAQLVGTQAQDVAGESSGVQGAAAALEEEERKKRLKLARQQTSVQRTILG